MAGTQGGSTDEAMQQLVSTLDFPVLRENVWHIRPDAAISFLETIDGLYEVDTPGAREFMRIRSHCTPNNSVAAISERSGVSQEHVVASLLSLIAPDVLMNRHAGMTHDTPLGEPGLVLEKVASLWGRELQHSIVINRLFDTPMPKTVLIGWLFEMYHYVADFPHAIQVAAEGAEGELRALLTRYAQEEHGHEEFVVQSLMAIGFSRGEIVSSRPLASTRALRLLMRDVFKAHPAAALLLSHMVEAAESPDDVLLALREKIEHEYRLPPDALEPIFRHQAIDAALGHQTLLSRYRHMIPSGPEPLLDAIVSGLHDIKHMFELQSDEICSYYGNLDGKFLPAQMLRFSAL